MRLEDIVIILSRPSEPGNVGAVCRAMKNMGLQQLRVVGSSLQTTPGLPPAGTAELLARAVHAADIWENAEFFDSLEAALADCVLSVGTTRRRGHLRKTNTLTARELAGFLQPRTGKTAIVFGNERTGLEGAELELCNMASHILVSPEFPSINLSHAVQIYAYELFQALTEKHQRPYTQGGPSPVSGQWVPMTGAEIGELVQKISDSLASVGFYKHPGREDQERFLRDLAARAGLSLSEGRYFENIIVKAGRLARSSD
jgi:tRNA/rRNA methyltransferase/tRNA (cytidine32/uridine32-2'-O)-methyltransferase